MGNLRQLMSPTSSNERLDARFSCAARRHVAIAGLSTFHGCAKVVLEEQHRAFGLLHLLAKNGDCIKRSTKENFQAGSISLQTISVKIRYSYKPVFTIYGVCGLKVWMCFDKISK